MGDNYPPIPDIGDKVKFIDSDGDEYRAVVVSTVPDADYITVARGDGAELGNDYVTKVQTETSVYPHPSVWDGDTASETLAYKEGW